MAAASSPERKQLLPPVGGNFYPHGKAKIKVIDKVEVAGITVTALLVTAAVVVSVVACFITLGTSGLITIAVLGGAAVLSASGTGIYHCYTHRNDKTSETAAKVLSNHEESTKHPVVSSTAVSVSTTKDTDFNLPCPKDLMILKKKHRLLREKIRNDYTAEQILRQLNGWICDINFSGNYRNPPAFFRVNDELDVAPDFIVELGSRVKEMWLSYDDMKKMSSPLISGGMTEDAYYDFAKQSIMADLRLSNDDGIMFQFISNYVARWLNAKKLQATNLCEDSTFNLLMAESTGSPLVKVMIRCFRERLRTPEALDQLTNVMSRFKQLDDELAVRKTHAAEVKRKDD